MHGKSARTEAAHGRAARESEGHGRALLPCAVLLALVALLIVPTSAFADGGGGSHYFGGDGSANYRTVLYSSNYADGVQYIVGADNKYDAAAYICGQTSAQVAAYDLVTRYKLSATENDFAALADRLERVWPGWNEETLGQNLASVFARVVDGTSLWDVMTNILSGSLSMFQVHYWQNNVDCDIYAIDTTANAVTLARDDLQEILNGGGSGGGGTSADLPEGYTLLTGGTRNDYLFTCVANTSYAKESSIVCDMQYSGATEEILTYPNYALVCNQSSSNYTDVSYIFIGTTEGMLLCTKDSDNTLYVYNPTDTTGGFRYGYRNKFSEKNSNGIVSFPFGVSMYGSDVSPGQLKSVQSFRCDYVSANQTGSTPDPDPPSGPGNWPDPPTNPTPPDPPTVPDPPQNPEPDPPSTPVAPTPPPLEPPTNVIIPTGTTPQDYTPWLRAILEQLQTLTDELASHCVHLQEEMQTSVNELQDTLIYRFNSLESQIWELFNGLEDYLHDLAAWLAEQLSFNVNVDPYDDKSVLYWLRQIYGRLGNQPKAPTTVMDPDPTEPFDFWAWLMGLIANTVGGIIGDLVGDVAGLLDLFKDKFPFSIPWDIAALLGLLDGTRATPVFDVKLPAVAGWWQETTFRIDLTPFDGVASACRTMVNILWIMALVMRTQWMLETMDSATSFGERFARKVARTS